MSLAFKSRKEGEDSKEHLLPKKWRTLVVHTSKKCRPEKDFSWLREINLARSDISDEASLLRVVTPPAAGIAFH
jgi:hypothetical protein